MHQPTNSRLRSLRRPTRSQIAGLLAGTFLVILAVRWYSNPPNWRTTKTFYLTWTALVDEITLEQLLKKSRFIRIGKCGPIDSEQSPAQSNSSEPPATWLSGYCVNENSLHEILSASLAANPEVVVSDRFSVVHEGSRIVAPSTSGSGNQAAVGTNTANAGTRSASTDGRYVAHVAWEQMPLLKDYHCKYAHLLTQASATLEISRPDDKSWHFNSIRGNAEFNYYGKDAKRHSHLKDTFQDDNSFESDFRLEKGEAFLLVARNPGYTMVNGAVVLVCERVEFPLGKFADAFASSGKSYETQKWIESRSVVPFNPPEPKTEWEQVAIRTPVEPIETFTHTLKDGRIVSLLAVKRFGYYNKSMWLPDGTPIDFVPFSNVRSYSAKRRPPKEPRTLFFGIYPAGTSFDRCEEYDLRNFITIDFRRLHYTSSEYLRFSARVTRGNITDLEKLEMYVSHPYDGEKNVKTASVDVMISSGEWQKIGESVNAGDADFHGRRINILKIENARSIEQSKGPELEVSMQTVLQPDEDLKLVARLKNGNRVEPMDRCDLYLSPPEGTVNRTTRWEQRFSGIFVEDLDTLEAYVRPLERIRFEGIDFTPEESTERRHIPD
ncbi:MAG: hypothetical protein KDA68_16780 [Planctomycetaceae bacterium]|nr:hypothetical protein [Planctomycetaceae bacterium]